MNTTSTLKLRRKLKFKSHRNQKKQICNQNLHLNTKHSNPSIVFYDSGLRPKSILMNKLKKIQTQSTEYFSCKSLIMLHNLPNNHKRRSYSKDSLGKTNSNKTQYKPQYLIIKSLLKTPRAKEQSSSMLQKENKKQSRIKSATPNLQYTKEQTIENDQMTFAPRRKKNLPKSAYYHRKKKSEDNLTLQNFKNNYLLTRWDINDSDCQYL